MNSFSITRKKTPFQKHREEEEEKKKRAEDETARIYAQFAESFQGGDTPGSKTFVRGGTINPNEKLKTDSEGGNSKDGVSVPKKGTRYVPSFLPPASKGRELEKKKEDDRPKEKEKGKPRIIDNFLEELKAEQELREKRNQEREQWREGRYSDSSSLSSRFDELPEDFDLIGKLTGPSDDGDPQTTNLYVGNLSPQVDENFLLRTFGRFGPIASVKIMWPRTEEERRRQRNCGFVAFMNRADGQAAQDEMQGVVIYEYELKIGWGKSVALPAQALPAPPPGQMAIRSKDGGTVVLSGPDGLPVASIAGQNSDLVLTPNVPDILVTPPEDKHMRHVIDTMALHVLDGGCAFEQAIMERGRGNPLFNFLFELGLKEHTYYVWRLYSFAQGDTLQRWRTEPFIMITGSGRWVPPALPIRRSPELEKDTSTYAAGRSRRMEVERSLTDLQRDEFEDMLRALTLERSQIKEAMGFSLDNAEAAGEIVEVLTESLTLKETAIPTKVARLMLVSDILHNSSAPVKNASAYRTKFEVNLPDIMESFNDLYRSVTGRITAEALKERVLKVLQVWADWFLFSDAFVNGLRATFLRTGISGVVPFHLICGDVPEIENKTSTEENPDGGKVNQDAALAMGKGAAMKELLGLPLAELERRCRHNGTSLVGGREMMIARLLHLEEAERQRSFEHDDDLRHGHRHSNRYSKDNDGSMLNNAHGRDTYLAKEPLNSSKWNQHYDESILENKQSLSSVSGTTHPILQGEIQTLSIKKGKSDPILLDSKWNRDNDESDEEDAKKGSHGLGLSYSSSGSEGGGLERTDEVEGSTNTDIFSRTDSSMSEEHRQKLRRLEVAVIEYRESLEEKGIRNLEDIERKVASYRRRLQIEFGLLDSSGGRNKQLSQRTLRKEKRDDSHDSSKKRRRSKSRSCSPPKKPYTREKGEADRDRDRLKGKDRFHDAGSKREREKSGSREPEGHDGDRSHERRSKGK